jgi:hypothetical protein
MSLKDRPQKVKDTLLPRKHPSAFERHLCPQAINKKQAIKPNPYPDPGYHQFPGPPSFPAMQSFSSLLYKLHLSNLCCWSLPVLSFSE